MGGGRGSGHREGGNVPILPSTPIKITGEGKKEGKAGGGAHAWGGEGGEGRIVADRIVVPAGGVWSRRYRCAPRLCHLGAHGEGQPLARAALIQSGRRPSRSRKGTKGIFISTALRGSSGPKVLPIEALE